MIDGFCKRTARKIRKLGYTKEEALRLSRFCYLSMMSASGVLLFALSGRRAGLKKELQGSSSRMAGAMPDPSMKSMAGEEDEKLPRLRKSVLSDVPGFMDRWHGRGTQGARVSVPHVSHIQRRLPAP